MEKHTRGAELKFFCLGFIGRFLCHIDSESSLRRQLSHGKLVLQEENHNRISISMQLPAFSYHLLTVSLNPHLLTVCHSLCVPPPPPLLTGTLSGYLLRILADSTHRCSVGEQRESQKSQGCERPPWRHSLNLKYKTDRGQRVYMNDSAWYHTPLLVWLLICLA